ncbi:hypothetical protein Mapa_002090 [Marchantia paleacea]|nr:hypothetical protein Mapa_002090 [Marchantia paleacea]
MTRALYPRWLCHAATFPHTDPMIDAQVILALDRGLRPCIRFCSLFLRPSIPCRLWKVESQLMSHCNGTTFVNRKKNILPWITPLRGVTSPLIDMTRRPQWAGGCLISFLFSLTRVKQLWMRGFDRENTGV